jgi:hypothetical protein
MISTYQVSGLVADGDFFIKLNPPSLSGIFSITFYSDELKLPQTLRDWIEEQRGGMSREAFVVSKLVNLMNKSIMEGKNTNKN